MFDFLRRRTTYLESGLLKGGADHHSHILYGVDDGVRTEDEAMDILDWYTRHGLSHLWCTPHIMEDMPNTTDGLKARFLELKSAYKGPIQLHLAAEYMLDNLYTQRLEEGDLLLHGPGRVLLETSTIAPPLHLWEQLERTMSLGYRPIIAHPERYRYMSLEDYARLKAMGVLMQLNMTSLSGYYGKDTLARAEWLLKHGYYTMTGSDCHRLAAFRNQCHKKALPYKDVEKLRPLMRPYLEEA